MLMRKGMYIGRRGCTPGSWEWMWWRGGGDNDALLGVSQAGGESWQRSQPHI